MLNWFSDEGDKSLDFYRFAQHQDSAEFAALAGGLDSLLSIDEIAERLARAEMALAEAVPLIPLYADLNAGVAWAHVGGYRHSALPGGALAQAASWWTIGD